MNGERTASNISEPGLGDALVQRGLLGVRDLDRALLAQREMGGMLGEVLIRLGLVAELDLAKVLCEQLDVLLATKGDYPDEPVVIEGLPEHFLLNHRIVPISASPERAVFAGVDYYPFLKSSSQ